MLMPEKFDVKTIEPSGITRLANLAFFQAKF